jgi:hypothetical protein
MLSVESLKIMYETNYALIESKVFTLNELEVMIPWERRVYIGLHIKNIQEKNEKIETERKRRMASRRG